MTTENQLVLKIKTGAAHIVPEETLIGLLSQDRPLTIKLGMDPTAPDLHLGHTVVLKKLRDFQDLGHNTVLVIGDFTARIGDPTGKSKTRPPLSIEHITKNQETYVAQASRILDMSKLKIVYNSEWLSKLTFVDVVQLCSKITLARIIERDDFKKRFTDHVSIGFHELLYPLMQAYDSVALHADVELGGTDQTFNLMMGRFLQEEYGQRPQAIITMPLLEGLDGVFKMSKSLNNAIVLNQSADNAFGQLMSLSDTLMWRYAELLRVFDECEIIVAKNSVEQGVVHPFEMKKNIAEKIVSGLWSADQAVLARAQFKKMIQDHSFDSAPIVKLDCLHGSEMWIVDLLRALPNVDVTSSSQARRLIESGAVSVDGKKVTDFEVKIVIKSGLVVKVGKHSIYKVA
jgi:tyrosyl-tRNA synthetase